MSKGDNIGMVIGSLVGCTSLGVSGVFGYMSADTLSEQLSSGAGADDFCASTTESGEYLHDISDGNYFALTTVGGLLSIFSGSSTGGPLIIRVFSENSKPYSSIEKKAKQIYDRYDGNHPIVKDEGVSLLSSDPEVASLVNDIISSAGSKEELLLNLAVLESVIDTKEGEKGSIQEEPKVAKKRWTGQRRKI